MVLIVTLLSLAYVLIFIGALLGIPRLINLEKRLFPILKDSIEGIAPTLSFHHEIVAGIYFSLSILPKIMEEALVKILIAT